MAIVGGVFATPAGIQTSAAIGDAAVDAEGRVTTSTSGMLSQLGTAMSIAGGGSSVIGKTLPYVLGSPSSAAGASATPSTVGLQTQRGIAAPVSAAATAVTGVSAALSFGLPASVAGSTPRPSVIPLSSSVGSAACTGAALALSLGATSPLILGVAQTSAGASASVPGKDVIAGIGVALIVTGQSTVAPCNGVFATGLLGVTTQATGVRSSVDSPVAAQSALGFSTEICAANALSSASTANTARGQPSVSAHGAAQPSGLQITSSIGAASIRFGVSATVAIQGLSAVIAAQAPNARAGARGHSAISPILAGAGVCTIKVGMVVTPPANRHAQMQAGIASVSASAIITAQGQSQIIVLGALSALAGMGSRTLLQGLYAQTHNGESNIRSVQILNLQGLARRPWSVAPTTSQTRLIKTGEKHAGNTLYPRTSRAH